MLDTTALVAYMRDTLNPSHMAHPNPPQATLDQVKRIWDQLDRQMSFGAETPLQWDHHGRRPDRVEAELEYWRGR